MKEVSCAFNDFRISLVYSEGVDFGSGSRIAILSHYLDDLIVSTMPKVLKKGKIELQAQQNTCNAFVCQKII